VPPRPSPLAPGYKLDRYELLCPIAEGGMASVWIARQTGKHGFRKLVAIKTILPKYAAEPKFQRMFIDEARIASRIEHANVTQILDVGEQHGVTYLVMEYVDGDALSRIHRVADKKSKPIPLGVLLRVLADVCGGLHAAHELRDEGGLPLGVVHRDVSPQNVLVTTRGAAKLIDFGIAKARDRLAGDTNADQMKGKVHYMAPEHAVGRPTDRRADVWAVGAVLYHLLAGKPPYEGDNQIQTLFLLSSGRPPVPLPPGVDPHVVAVVKRALSQRADARYATAAELQAALEEAMVKARVPTTQAMVASYVADLVGDKAERRKEAIAIGLRAADEREKVAAVMQSNAVIVGAETDGAERVVTEWLGPPGRGGVRSAGDSSSAGDSPSEAPASVSGATPAHAMEMPVRQRGRGRAVVVVAAIAAAGVAVTLGLSGTGPSRSSAAAGAASPAVVGAPATSTAEPASGDVVPAGSAAASSGASAGATAPGAPPGSEAASSAPPSAAAASPATRPVRRAPFAPRSAPAVKRRINDGF
jgi:hypothetical protein